MTSGALAFGMALALSGGSAAAESCVPDAAIAEASVARIQARYDGIRDLRARFEQVTESAAFEGAPSMASEPKRGRVVFAKPGKMRWTYEEPDRSVVVSDGKRLWIHDVAAESVTRLEVTEGFLSGAALQFLLGDGKIADSFDVRATQCDATTVTLDLVPRAEATYERLGLVADRATGNILASSVLDLFGNLTQIRFEDVEVNLDPPQETFVLEIPEGVEVIEYEAQPAD
jgi:outer membrane lipoprotein carrier protein